MTDDDGGGVGCLARGADASHPCWWGAGHTTRTPPVSLAGPDGMGLLVLGAETGEPFRSRWQGQTGVVHWWEALSEPLRSRWLGQTVDYIGGPAALGLECSSLLSPRCVLRLFFHWRVDK